MRVMYYGDTFCSEATLKRLLVIAREIAFLDRPSIALGHWGTVGRPTLARQFEPLEPEVGVSLSAHSPPTRQAGRIFKDYIDKDLRNPRFRAHVLRGLKEPDFASRMMQFDGKYKNATGRQIVDALLSDQSLSTVHDTSPFNRTYEIDSEEGRRDTFDTIVVEASIQVTCGLVGAEEADCSPLTDSRVLDELWSIRMGDAAYLGAERQVTMIGSEIARAVLPDHLIDQLTIADILSYRTKAKDAYDAWLTELEAQVETLEMADANEIPKVITKIAQQNARPRALEYKRSLESVRDDLFGDAIKSIPKWSVPAILMAHLGGAAAIIGFVGSLTGAGIDTAVNYFKSKRGARRKHAVSYLVDVVHGKTLGSE
jgi:hypothetical protein